MTDEAKIEAMARAWNAWWSSVSTGASDKHMQCAFEAGYSAATEGMVPRVMLDDVAGLVERLEMSVAFDPPVLRKACKEAATAITSLASTVADLKRQLAEARGALDILQMREAAYRLAHDLYGDGDRKAGSAWDAMRHAGDCARAHLAQKSGD